MNILQAIQDPNLFGPFLGTNHSSWEPWFGALAALYGLPVPWPQRDTVRACTGRKIRLLPPTGFQTALFLTGRRSGKSRISAVIAAFEAVLSNNHLKLAKGEKGVVAVIAPTRAQSEIVKGYIRGIFETPLLQNEIVSENGDSFELSNGVSIMVLTGDHRSVRGFTLLAVVVDEAAFFGLDAEARVKSDTELIRALKPGLATTGGKLIGISSPYARRGWCFKSYERCFGNDAAKMLLWNAPSRTMNSTLPQSVVDDAIADDLQAAKSEYLGEFRDDVGEFLPRAVIESIVVKGRLELLPRERIQYMAFADMSGGRADDAALCIAHRDIETNKGVIDLLRRYRPPFSPAEIIVQMVGELRNYGIRRVTGDNYAAEFVARGFQGQKIFYEKSEKPKAALYLELLPRICSGQVELLDNPHLVNQLASLERRTRQGGRDLIDHPPGGHDDSANVVAGAIELALRRRRVVGSMFRYPLDNRNQLTAAIGSEMHRSAI